MNLSSLKLDSQVFRWVPFLNINSDWFAALQQVCEVGVSDTA